MASKEITVELRLRREIAACTLILNHLGILGYSGHISSRLGDDGRFLIQPIDESRASLKPEDLLICDLSGNLVAGAPERKPPSEVFIHSEIYRARRDVRAVAHFHHDIATVFTLVRGAVLQPVKNHAARWADGVPIHPDPAHVSTRNLGKTLANTLARHFAVNLRAHGQVIVAETVPALLMDSVHFVENAEALYRARLLGSVRALSKREIQNFLRDFDREKHGSKLWKYYVGLGVGANFLPREWGLL